MLGLKLNKEACGSISSHIMLVSCGHIVCIFVQQFYESFPAIDASLTSK
jgi:hypothetical protein